MDVQNLDDTYDFVASHLKYQADKAREWTAAGLTFAWVDTRPKWMPVCDWSWPTDTLGNWQVLINPTEPCRRAWSFSLIGGGQIRITEHWVKSTIPAVDKWLWNPKTTLVIAAHVNEQLRVQRGQLIHCCGDMQTHAVVLQGKAEGLQQIADRAAATLRTLAVNEHGDCTEPDRERFFALLDGTRGCGICGRPLRDEISKLLGVGPDCARRWQIPHSRAAASKRLELRAQILGEDQKHIEMVPPSGLAS